MPLTSKEEVASWGVDTDGCDAFVYLTDGLMSHVQKAKGLPLEEAMIQEIVSLGLNPKDFASFDGGGIAQRGEGVLVWVACRKGPDWKAACERRVTKLAAQIKLMCT